MPVAPFTRVLRRVKGAGFQLPFIRQALPRWWDDAAAEHPSGLEEGIGYLASRLGLAPASLRDGERAEFVTTIEPRFKARTDVAREVLLPAEHVAIHALRLAARATPQADPVPRLHALELRRVLLEGGRPWVTFDRLLDWCWANGIPVLHLGAKVGKKKMDALAARFSRLAFADGDRYGIVLCCNYKAPSRLLFHLAHEVAHVLLGHLPKDGVIIDEAVESRLDDQQEREADDYAWTLLSGAEDFEPYGNSRWNGLQLASAADEQSQRLRIAPGTLALAYGYEHSHWGAAHAALARLEAGQDAPQMMRNVLARRLDWSALAADDADYLRTLTGLNDPVR